jgi:hypothetical protein
MAEISLSLADLFEQTFGYRTQAFDPQFKHVTGFGNSLSDRKEQGISGSPYYANDARGNEYYLPVTITYPDVSTLPDPPPGLLFSGDDNSFAVFKKWNLPYPVVSISSKKTIIETPLTERRGTVKELINIQDYEIVIKGFMIGNTNEFPEEDVTMLRTLYEQNSVLSIQCPLTDVFLIRPDRNGSDKVVISALQFPPVTGIKNVRPYELHMVSDESFNLITI